MGTGGASSHGRGCLADLPADSTSSTYIWPMVRGSNEGGSDSERTQRGAGGNSDESDSDYNSSEDGDDGEMSLAALRALPTTASRHQPTTQKSLII